MVNVIEADDTGRYCFYCPGCKCDHYIQFAPKKPCWLWDSNLQAPTVNPSILVHYYNDPEDGKKETGRCHLFIKKGMIEFLTDCTHELAGQTVPMQEV